MAKRKADTTDVTVAKPGPRPRRSPQAAAEPVPAIAETPPAAEAAPPAPKRKRGRPPKDPLKGPATEAERAKKARTRRHREREEYEQRTQRLANSLAVALLYLADADPAAASWVVTPLAPKPESQALDTIAANLHAEQLAWVAEQMVTAEERELLGRFVAAIQTGRYATDAKLRAKVDAHWGYRRKLERDGKGDALPDESQAPPRSRKRSKVGES